MDNVRTNFTKVLGYIILSGWSFSFLLLESQKEGTIRKREIDLHVNIEVDEPVHVNTKKRSIVERKLDLLIKCTEAIVTKKLKSKT